MLVAGASLSLLAPVAAQASNAVNVEEMNSYSRSQAKSSRIDSKTFINEVSEDLANLEGPVDGLEARQNNYEAGGFSETTVLDGKAVMWIGAGDGGNGDDKLSGGIGDDILDGESGIDDMRGGSGDDTYIVDNSKDIIREASNEGTDLVQSSASY